MAKDISQQLVEFAVNTRYEDIPEETLVFTKCLTLKTVAGMLGGSRKPSGKKMAGLIREKRYPEQFGVIGGGFKTALWESIFLNSYFSHASELEDDRIEQGGFSWDITVIPLVLPLAQKLGLSGKALMEALVVGLEVHTRTATFSGQHVGHFLVPGAIGPALGAAKALGLGIHETAGAMGLALSAVPLSVVNLGTDAHFFESSLMALQGIMAGEMAKEGLRGNPNVTKYLSDYLGSGKGNVVPERMVDGLGKRWTLREIQIKKYPCCIALHRHIDSVVELKRENDLSYEDLDVIEVHGSPGDIICNRSDPTDENDLQFSFQHTLAVAMMDGDVSLERITHEAVADPALTAGRTKVKFILHPDLPSEYLEAPAKVVIKMKDGKEYARERMYPLGHLKDPLTLDQFKALYAKLTKGLLSEEKISKTTDLILNLEKIGNIKELMDLVI
ncbi:MAG: MmgE/PrpD family protein [Pseudomonadota bacterium]